jgi:hypothetical protein
MKSTLLTTTALIAFAGAAFADGHSANDGVSFSGVATLGYNNTTSTANTGTDDDDSDVTVGLETYDNEFGFYSDLEVTLGLSKALDNGLTVAASIDLEDLADGADASSDYTLSVTSETASMYYGDTKFAAESKWSEVGDMAASSFSEQDGETVLRGEGNVAGVDAAVSAVINGDKTEQVSLGATATFGMFNLGLGYQDSASTSFTAARGTADNDVDGFSAAANGDFNGNKVYAVSVGGSFAGADVALGYADNSVETSTGISVAYPVGPVALSASYADNSVSIDAWDIAATYAAGAITATISTDEGDDYALEGSYDLGNGAKVFAGVADGGDDYYVAASYDLGGGASVLASYADDQADDSEDEVGANEYQNGATVELTFTF